ncbi:nucleoside deaminase [candidate division KSB1 bacterium]|nr:nucleoside deaminase [candidate division KSB1 bacterium]MBL7095394.1 nucleoside deaminase [candidate division KSB1 bacterium]
MTYHEKWMKQAFLEAEKAYDKEEVPVGAVIIFEDRIIGRGHNLVETLQDPTAHAEIIAITAAANYLAHWRLEETTIYVTLEPCPMCAGAILNSRIQNIIFGAFDVRFGACGSVTNVLENNGLNLPVNVIPGILQTNCESIIKNFFVKLRTRSLENRNN